MLDGFEEKYVNPFTDFGFKKLFGEEPNKGILLDFLNELLYEEEGRIKDLTFLKNEHLGSGENDRRAIFDLYCESERGEKFIVELQKSKQSFFKDRALYYSTFPIVEQAQKTEWNYELKAVYTVAILDFVFDEDKNDPGKYRYNVKLSDIDTGKVFYDKFTFVYLEMPKFTKKLSELTSRFEKWMYVIRNLNRLEGVPAGFEDSSFLQLFKVAEIARMNRTELRAYEDSLKYYRDLKNSFDTAREEALAEGRAEGAANAIRQIVVNGAQNGVGVDALMALTGLSEAQVLEILQAEWFFDD